MQCNEIPVLFITSIWYVLKFIFMYSIAPGAKSNRLINTCILLLLLNYMRQQATKLFSCVLFSLITGYNKMLDKMIIKRGQYFSECDDDLGPGV